MSKDLRAKIAKDFVDVVISPDFGKYTYQGKLMDGDDEKYIENTSVHLVYVGDNTCIVTYNGNTGELHVYCVNICVTILKANFDEGKSSWTFEGVFGEDLFGSTIIHACKVLKRLHSVAMENEN